MTKEELNYQDIQIKELAQKTGLSKNTIANYLTVNGNLPIPDLDGCITSGNDIEDAIDQMTD